MSERTGKPFLRWAGGKRWLAPRLAEALGGWDGPYVEPFLGSGALFFALRPKRAVLADTNEDLIACYRGVREDPQAVVERLLELGTDEKSYYSIRARRPKTDIERAVWFIYLNRTSFNGLWRVNRAGAYNVPWGHREPDLSWLEGDILAAGDALERAELLCQDFATTMSHRRRGTLIFCDPPYITGHENNGFREYNQKLFSWEDQEALAKRALDAASRGVEVIVTNAHHSGIAELYAELHAHEHARHCGLSGAVTGRAHTTEYLFASTGVHERLTLAAAGKNEGAR